MYGDRREYKKINFYSKNTGEYLCSTNWAKTCKEAMYHMGAWEGKNGTIELKDIKASYK